MFEMMMNFCIFIFPNFFNFFIHLHPQYTYTNSFISKQLFPCSYRILPEDGCTIIVRITTRNTPRIRIQRRNVFNRLHGRTCVPKKTRKAISKFLLVPPCKSAYAIAILLSLN
ncbi:hypothetical protein Hanom_Chr09g00859711 [Helianthus anomalus]